MFSVLNALKNRIIILQYSSSYVPMSYSNISTHKTVFFIGPPGAGKSTAADSVRKTYNLHHISTGRILREYDSNTSTGDIIKRYISQRKVPPAYIIKNILKEHFNNSKCNGYILDGYPLTTEYIQILFELNIVPEMIFYFNCADNIAVERQCMRNDRESDNINSAAQRVEYFRNLAPKEKSVCQLLNTNCDVVYIDAEDTMQNVKLRILDKLSTLFIEN